MKKVWDFILNIITLGISKKVQLQAVVSEIEDVVTKYKLAKADGKITKEEVISILDELVDVYAAVKEVI